MTKFMTLAVVATVLTASAGYAREAPKPAADIAPDRRVCIVQPPITGSRLPTKLCKTVADWRKDGIDPSKLIAGKK